MSAQDVPVDFAVQQDTAMAVHRNAGLDALRACLTLLVVFHHCAITYGALGGWYYHEVAAGPSVESALLTFFCAINQAFFMGLFFFLAGCYTPPSIDRKGTARFLADRFLRLGLPLLVYGFLIGPATIALARSGTGHPFADTLGRLWRKGTFENGPMWFAEALLIFSAAAALWHIAFPRAAAHDPNRAARFPSDRTLAAAACLTGIAALALRSRWPIGINVWGLQLGYFASYIVLYAAGCRTARVHWIAHLPARQVSLWWRIALLALPVLPIAYVLAKHIPALRGRPQDVIYAFWEPLVAWGTILFLVSRFQRRFDRLTGAWQPLSRRAYTIYVIHPPVLVAAALAWRHVPAAPFVKFAVTGSVACVACYLIAGLLLRVPRLASIL
ncbi:MAG: acyltransferase [Burkholderia sp.]|jgi:peptidoglycan/LPS O-acetylase OafA/YrhL|nr:acyltransferase [Burkholderia sp.]MCA3786975.1 acyltransferase [Burkholderia sp.]MCA3796927.1 acyltransferase [Burkholderia sp.]MCA3801020.1 acyltransferase [Burkholderia sp.]MCA3813121.1 acyltransferase [Burkholderia sp.]